MTEYCTIWSMTKSHIIILGNLCGIGPGPNFTPRFVCLVGFLTSSLTTRLYHERVPRMTYDNYKCCYTPDRAGRPWFLSQLVTFPTRRERVATAGIELRTSSTGVVHSPTELPQLQLQGKAARVFKQWGIESYPFHNFIKSCSK